MEGAGDRADGNRVLAVLDAEQEELKPEAHLRVVLNVGDEIRRRIDLAGRK